MALLPVFSHVADVITHHLQRANMIKLEPYYNNLHYSVTFSVRLMIPTILKLAEELVFLVQFRGVQNEFMKKMGPLWKDRVKSTIFCHFCQVIYFYKHYTDYGANTLNFEHFSTVYPGVKFPGAILLLNTMNYTREIVRIAPFGHLTLRNIMPKDFVDNFLNPAWHTDPLLKECINIWQHYGVPFNDPQVANDCAIIKLLLPEIVFILPDLSILGSPHYCLGDVVWHGNSFMILEGPASVTSLAFGLLFSTEIETFVVDGFEVVDIWQRVGIAGDRSVSPVYGAYIFELVFGVDFNSGFVPTELLGSGGEVPVPTGFRGGGPGPKPKPPSSGGKGRSKSGPGSTSAGEGSSALGRKGGGSEAPSSTVAEVIPIDSGRELRSHAVDVSDVDGASVADSATTMALTTINGAYNAVSQVGSRVRNVASVLSTLNGLAQTALAVGNLAVANANARGYTMTGGSINLPGMSLTRMERRRIAS